MTAKRKEVPAFPSVESLPLSFKSGKIQGPVLSLEEYRVLTELLSALYKHNSHYQRLSLGHQSILSKEQIVRVCRFALGRAFKQRIGNDASGRRGISSEYIMALYYQAPSRFDTDKIIASAVELVLRR